MVINTWKRNDLLKRSVSHYSSCQGVDAIRVVWSEPTPPSDSLRSSLEGLVELATRKKHRHVSLQLDIHVDDDLNNRFKPLDGLSTDAILSIDDDVLVPCGTVESAFSAWTSAPNSMVGFVPRMHWIKAMVRMSLNLTVSIRVIVFDACLTVSFAYLEHHNMFAVGRIERSLV